MFYTCSSSVLWPRVLRLTLFRSIVGTLQYLTFTIRISATLFSRFVFSCTTCVPHIWLLTSEFCATLRVLWIKLSLSLSLSYCFLRSLFECLLRRRLGGVLILADRCLVIVIFLVRLLSHGPQNDSHPHSVPQLRQDIRPWPMVLQKQSCFDNF